MHISKLARSRPPSVSPGSLDHGLLRYFQTHLIVASMFQGSGHPSACPNSIQDRRERWRENEGVRGHDEPPKVSVSNGSGLPGCGPGLKLDRMVQFRLLPGKQGYPAGSGMGRNRTAVLYYGSCNFASNQVSEF